MCVQVMHAVGIQVMWWTNGDWARSQQSRPSEALVMHQEVNRARHSGSLRFDSRASRLVTQTETRGCCLLFPETIMAQGNVAMGWVAGRKGRGQTASHYGFLGRNVTCWPVLMQKGKQSPWKWDPYGGVWPSGGVNNSLGTKSERQGDPSGSW